MKHQSGQYSTMDVINDYSGPVYFYAWKKTLQV